MSKREDYENRTEELLTPIAEVSQVEIYDVEYVKEGSDYYLRAYIDKPEGVNILDCEMSAEHYPKLWTRLISFRMLTFWKSAARDWVER